MQSGDDSRSQYFDPILCKSGSHFAEGVCVWAVAFAVDDVDGSDAAPGVDIAKRTTELDSYVTGGG